MTMRRLCSHMRTVSTRATGCAASSAATARHRGAGPINPDVIAAERHFEQPRRAHAAAGAHRHHHVALAAAPPFGQCVPGHARARHAERMADRLNAWDIAGKDDPLKIGHHVFSIFIAGLDHQP